MTPAAKSSLGFTPRLCDPHAKGILNGAAFSLGNMRNTPEAKGRVKTKALLNEGKF